MEEDLLALSSADKAKPAITDYSLDSPMHGHLGQRMGIFAPEKAEACLRVKSPHVRIGATVAARERLVKGQSRAQRLATISFLAYPSVWLTIA